MGRLTQVNTTDIAAAIRLGCRTIEDQRHLVAAAASTAPL